MLLGKSCQSPYHIKHGTLKLGTLHEYRTIENEELIDREEGMLRFHLNFHGQVRISAIWFNTLSNGNFTVGNGQSLKFPGRTLAAINHIQWRQISEDEIELTDSSTSISREAHNSFIFCVSKIRKTSDCHGIFKKCDDYWYIKEQHIKAFAEAACESLSQHIHTNHANGQYILPKETNLANLKVAVEIADINYVSREIHLYDNGFMALDLFASKIQRMAFTKPDSYANEREVRFNFKAIVDGKVIAPIVKSVILDATEMKKHVFWL